jgi:lipid A 3-O-deacylase
MGWYGAALCVCALATVGRPASALAGPTEEPALLAFGVGYFDIVSRESPAVDFRLEYRSDWDLWIFRPFAGIAVNTDSAVYPVGGLFGEIPIGDHLRIDISLGAGAYVRSQSKDLGLVLQFRSQIEFAYRMDDGDRVGLAFSHISNASIGDRNPGVEILTLYYAVPAL